MIDSTPQVPTPETIRQQELAKFVLRAMRARVIFVPIIAALATVLVLLDPTPWKLAVLAVCGIVWGSIVAMDLARVRQGRPYPYKFYPTEIIVAGLMQAGMILITGGMESPLVIIWIPLGMLAGVGLGNTLGRAWVLVAISAMIWLLALSGLLGWAPRTLPSFLQLDNGFHDNTVYILTKAAVLNMVIVVASQVGASLHGVFNRMLDQATCARQQTLELMAERNRELVHLSSTIAHELKNPLASIAGLVQLLALGRGRADRQEERFQMLGKEVDRMRCRLNELLNFSRPLGELNLRPIRPLDLMRELTALHEGMATERGVSLAPPAHDPDTAPGDRRKLKQALVNLLQNAIEASPVGATVQWVAARKDGYLLLGVEDRGPGFDPEARDACTRSGFTTKEGGSGVGLAVARGIAEQHGGTLLLEDRGGGGARALLRLPLDAEVSS